MPRGSKKRRAAAAKKKQDNRPTNLSSSSTRSPAVGNEEDTKHRDEKQSDVVRVEKESTVEESVEPNGVNSEPTGESNNGGGSSSSSSGNSSDDDVLGNKSSLPSEDVSSVEEVETIPSGSEKIPLLVEKVKSESLLEDTEVSQNQVGDNVGTSVVRNEEGFVQSDSRAEHENDSTVTEPLLVPEKKTSWISCCGLFEVFSGSGR